MAWSTSADGLAKARIKAIQSILQSKASDLHACILADSSLASITTKSIAFDETCILRGDYEGMWTLKTGGYLRIYVSAGGHRDATDMTQDFRYIGAGNTPGNKMRTYTTMLTALFHESAFSNYNPDIQATMREDAYMTVLDWIDFDIFGTNSYNEVSINSNCLDNADSHDRLFNNKIMSGGKIWTPTGSGNSIVLTGISVVLHSIV